MTEAQWSIMTEIERDSWEEAFESYTKETGRPWTETEERMLRICWFYNFTVGWNREGNIFINSMCETEEYNGRSIDQFFGYDFKDADAHLEHYEYEDAASMVEAWKDMCGETNEEYRRSGSSPVPFAWAA